MILFLHILIKRKDEIAHQLQIPHTIHTFQLNTHQIPFQIYLKSKLAFIYLK